MALSDLPAGMSRIYPANIANALLGSSTVTIDAADDDYAGFAVFAPKTAVISKIHFYVSASTFVGTIAVKPVTVASNGFLSTTAYGGGVQGTLTNPAVGWNTITFATPFTMTRGDLFGLNFLCTAYTSGSMTLLIRNGYPLDGAAVTNGIVWPMGYTAVGNTAPATIFVAYIEDDGGNIITFDHTKGLLFTSADATISFSNSSTPDEYGVRITMPFAARVIGFVMRWNTNLPSSASTLRLYSSGGTVLASVSPDLADYSVNPAYAPSVIHIPTPVELAKDAVVYLAHAPGATAKNHVNVTYRDAALCIADQGPRCEAYRTDGGAWTVNEDKTALFSLIIDQIDLGGGGGGLLVHPGMSGGMRG